MNFGSLFDELRRRRIFRVLGAYLLAIFVVLQVGDLVIEPLGLPDWVMTLLIVLAALGLPVTAALAWAFDVTPVGVVRGAPAGAGPAAEEDGSPASTRGPKRRRRLLAIIALVPLGLLGWFAWPGPGDEAALDEGLMVVLPFRVAGAAPGLAYLGEGLMDLLAARFSTGDALRVVPPREVLKSWSRPDEVDEAGGEEARAVARSLGAGSVLLGEIVGNEDQIVLTARLIGADGNDRTRATVSGSADSLHTLVDGLAAQLLAATAGTPRERLADMTTRSLPALRAYLEGARAFRAGRAAEAVRSFDRAVDQDSAFGLAALGLLQATGWASFVPTNNGARAARLAWRERDRLGAADRLYLEATLGREYPAPTPTRTQLEVSRQATTRMPDIPELWYLLGDLYYHEGLTLGFHDYLLRAERHFQTALELDSTHVGALNHLMDVAAIQRDTAKARRFSDRLVKRDAGSEMAARSRFALSRLGSDATGALLPDTLGPRALSDLGVQVLTTGVGIHEVGEALERAQRTDEASADMLWAAAFQLAANRGRVDEVRSLLERGIQNPHWPDVNRVVVETFLVGDARAAADAVERWDSLQPASDADPASLLAGRCMVGHWRLLQVNPADIESLIVELAEAGRDTTRGRHRGTFELCSLALTAHRDHRLGAAAADRSLAAVEAFLAAGRIADNIYKQIVGLTLARIYEERGDLAAALAAARRTVVPRPFLGGPLWLEEGRLAERLGERETAIEAYRQYLHWNRDAQPPISDRVAEVEQRLNRLMREGG